MSMHELAVYSEPSRFATAAFVGLAFLAFAPAAVLVAEWLRYLQSADRAPVEIGFGIFYATVIVGSFALTAFVVRAALQAAGRAPIAKLRSMGSGVWVFQPTWGRKRVLEGSAQSVEATLLELEGVPHWGATNYWGRSYWFRFDLAGSRLCFAPSPHLTVERSPG